MYVRVAEKKSCFYVRSINFVGKDRIVITTREELNKPCKANIVIDKPPEQPGWFPV